MRLFVVFNISKIWAKYMRQCVNRAYGEDSIIKTWVTSLHELHSSWNLYERLINKQFIYLKENLDANLLSHSCGILDLKENPFNGSQQSPSTCQTQTKKTVQTNCYIVTWQQWTIKTYNIRTWRVQTTAQQPSSGMGKLQPKPCLQWKMH